MCRCCVLFADSCVSDYKSCRNFLRMAWISGMLSPEKRSVFEGTEEAKVLESMTSRMRASMVPTYAEAAGGLPSPDKVDDKN
jgi:hypothetical protein